ncbi:MAG: hypothetical protein M1833_003902 [Piccolia ochrophora]|nr:MAG: hypothetical protein M1833_003902 [Piccolia ochrophora]
MSSVLSLRPQARHRPLASPFHIGLQNSDRIQKRFQHRPPEEQATPLGDYYELLLREPLNSRPPTLEASPSTAPSPTPTEKARVVFGSRLAGPKERRSELASRSTSIAGVDVPPRPLEPDNCCMSGCVNCVWDRFRDEVEEWAAKSAEARGRLQEMREKGQGTGLMNVGEGTPRHVAISMDDDGGGSETNWGTGIGVSEGGDIFVGIPVGIREFMKTEKRLKEKHAREVASSI